MNKDNLGLFKYFIFNGFHEAELSNTYEMHIQCKNTINGKIKSYKKYVCNEKGLEGDDLEEFFEKELQKFIKLKTQGDYEFVPYNEKES